MHTILRKLRDVLKDPELWVDEAWIKQVRSFWPSHCGQLNKKSTVLHSLLDLSSDVDYWTVDRLAQALLGIWFAAAHQPWMNLHFVILELASRPEYADSIRKEIDNDRPLNCSKIEGMATLDSFIRETIRLNPLDTRKPHRR